ncbi:MAG TPA: hypothetical protein VE135_17055 [Pyrinomonadaceae bacterium]|nr:hypothetical protein [Pyrinomonadaceae bacterium]
MEQNKEIEGKTAVCIGAPSEAKHAALFFENIWHLCPTHDSAPRAVFPEGFNHNRSLRDQYHEFTYNLAFTHPNIKELFDHAFTVVQPKPNAKDQTPLLLGKTNDVMYRMIEETYLQNVKGIRDRFLQLVAPLSPIHPIPVVSNARSLENQNASVADITVTLSNLQIIDVASTSWEQIVEFRKDAESAKALRKLRVFLYENCKDKSASYVEDKIHTELEKYDNAVKSHGFKLITGSLKTLIDSKSIIAASGTVLVAGLIGGPLVGVGAGAVLEASKLAIEISTTLYSMRELKRDHPLAYIIKAREELANGS